MTITTGHVISTDGTRIGYRRSGAGPGVVLVHGGMQSSENFTKLAAALSTAFTVYVPDRRGRGLSGPAGDDFGIRAEVDDLHALLTSTGAPNVFGLSSGAVIALQAATALPRITKLAIYEPPLATGTFTPLDWVGRYEREVADGRLAAAFVTTMKGTGGARLMPRFVLQPLVGHLLKADARTKRDGSGIKLADLVPTMRYDARAVAQSTGPLDRFRAVTCDVLLLGGTRSASYLKAALDGLEPVLPHVRRITFPRVGHLAAENQGRPDAVAAARRVFFPRPGSTTVGATTGAA
jgi:pimeloyl-ACP methyl ester carboxylesterase